MFPSSIWLISQQLLLLLLTWYPAAVNAFQLLPSPTHSLSLSSSSNKLLDAHTTTIKMSTTTDYPEFEKCLRREYASFFQPMEKTFYSNTVSFIDPMIKLTGVDAYKGNVDTLAGRTALGGLLFKDASIVLHNIIQLEKNKIQTRWTLQVTAKMFPGQPRAKFSGVSLYTLDEQSKQVVTQEDYSDSINLREGKYVTVPRTDGLLDFLSQLNQPQGAEMAAPELPYELLRRAKRYEVRRYPATVVAETSYEQRPQGYDRLGK